MITPNYPKPVVTKYASIDQELEDIVNKIKMEDLDDVAILSSRRGCCKKGK